MTVHNDGERLAVLETQVTNLTTKVNGIENSMSSLHGKFDAFTQLISENYVAIETLDAYKREQVEKEKNRNLEKLLWFIVGTVITGLVGFFLRENHF